jgi:hypothetical protein
MGEIRFGAADCVACERESGARRKCRLVTAMRMSVAKDPGKILGTLFLIME